MLLEIVHREAEWWLCICYEHLTLILSISASLSACICLNFLWYSSPVFSSRLWVMDTLKSSRIRCTKCQRNIDPRNVTTMMLLSNMLPTCGFVKPVILKDDYSQSRKLRSWILDFWHDFSHQLDNKSYCSVTAVHCSLSTTLCIIIHYCHTLTSEISFFSLSTLVRSSFAVLSWFSCCLLSWACICSNSLLHADSEASVVSRRVSRSWILESLSTMVCVRRANSDCIWAWSD